MKLPGDPANLAAWGAPSTSGPGMNVAASCRTSGAHSSSVPKFSFFTASSRCRFGLGAG